MPMRLAALLCAAGLLTACAAPPGPAASLRLRFIGEQDIAHRHDFQGTVVGGLSGIDYDARRGAWIMASDDRSEHGPARFYTARLDLDASGFRSVTLDAVHLFRQADGTTYPSATTATSPGDAVPDIEAIRFDPVDGSIWYASEGSDADPFVRHGWADGGWRANLPLPALLKVEAGRLAGPRRNLSFEGLAFAPDGRSLWLAMEAPLFQDGPLPDARHGALTRLTQFDRAGNVLAEYAYPLDPVQGTPAPGRFSDNGLAELLVASACQLLILERSGVQDAAGRFRFHIRLYLADITGPAGASSRPLGKRLLLDLNGAGIGHIDNLEGMAWGPVLANGNRTLVLVSDDNFDSGQRTQLLAFEVLPGTTALRTGQSQPTVSHDGCMPPPPA